MIAVVYHKVKKYDRNFKFDKFLHINNFKKQINFFQNNYNFIDCVDLFDKTNKFKKNDIFLTFDDGLKIHFKYVYPILKEKKINGIFYIPTLPFIKKKILKVHKIHLILGKVKNHLILKYIKRNISKNLIDENQMKKFDTHVYKKQRNIDENVKIKKFLNYTLKKEFQKDFVNKMFKFFFPTVIEERFVNNYYMNEQELKILEKNNMILGSHTVNHELLSSIPLKLAKKEIDLGVNYLSQFTDLKTFCYPYGSKISYNNKIKNYLKTKVSFSVTVTNKIISNKDFQKNRQELSRLDCNNFKYGKI
tara:strand:- start:5045 stop:5959 length:915 start_codon:yes stop_codon:yes gene_type:complete